MDGVTEESAADARPPDALTGVLERTELQHAASAVAGREIVQVLTVIPCGVASGWHIHPGRDTYMYVVSGSLVLEFGPGGRDRVEAAADLGCP